jgi:hypothetical protein
MINLLSKNILRKEKALVLRPLKTSASRIFILANLCLLYTMRVNM